MRSEAVLAGRYEVVRTLGAGGAGDLFLVKDRERNLESCALKILRQAAEDPGLVELFRSEFLVLAEIECPSIVGVREFGVLEEGTPFFTMDFVPGENARAFVKEDRLDANAYLDVAAGLLTALAHVHARGILHRDVKPENIILAQRAGRFDPMLVDFGLAVTAGAARAGEASGTLPYIPPEVIAGGAADERADLFAAGMVLYELCTGKHVADFNELLRAPARSLAPDRVRRNLRRSARGGVPRRFEDIVCGLTAPNRTARYPSAVAALRALAELYDEEYAAASLETAGRPRLGDAPFVGRNNALDLLIQRIEALKESRLLEPLVVVAGAEGMGVSRLLATLRNQAAVLGGVVCSGSSLHDLARSLAAHPQAVEGNGLLGHTPAEHVFRMDSILHGLPGGAFPVLLLDDVHRFRAEEVAALRDWIRALESRPGRAKQLLVIGGCSEGESPGAAMLRTAGGAVPVELRDLPPLKKSDVRLALVALLAQPRIPTEVVAELHRSSGGNPRLFNELLHLMVDEGVLQLTPDRPVLDEDAYAELELPETVLDAVSRRIERLPEDTRALLHRLALIEDRFPAAAADALDAPGVGRLRGEGYLERDRGYVRFPSEVLRRAADRLKGAARKRAQRDLAAAVRDRAPGVAAELLASAGDLAAAREIGLPAARRRIEQGRRAEACRLLEALLGDPPDAETSRLLLQVLLEVGRTTAVSVIADRMVESSEEPEVLLLAGRSYMAAGRTADALTVLTRLEQGPRPAEIALRIMNAKAHVLDAMGRYEDALAESRRAEAEAGSLLANKGNIARMRANIFRHQRRWRAASELEARVLESDDATEWTKVGVLLNHSTNLHRMGATLDSLKLVRRVLARARELDLQAVLARALENASWHLNLLGRASHGVRLAERSVTLWERVSGGVILSLVNQADALILSGRPGEAEQRLARIESLPGYAGSRFEGHVGQARARLAAHAGRIDEAIKACDKLLAKSDERMATLSIDRAGYVAAGGNPDVAEVAFKSALKAARAARERFWLPVIRIGLAECAGARGAWHRAERMLEKREIPELAWRTPLRARYLMIKALAAVSRDEAAEAGRLVEEAVAVANRCDDAPLRADIYRRAASLLEEGAIQRWLRKPTADASAALLEAARDIWSVYGNETMLRKIDLHLSELPRTAGDPLAGPESDRLVRVLHITREMNREFDRDRLLGLILDRAIELTGAERGFVILLREGREEVHLARNLDRESVSEPERKMSTQIINEVVRTGRIVRTENAEEDRRFDEYLSVRQLHLRSLIAVPFRSGRRTVGALYLDNRFRVGNFTEQDERLLELFSDQAVAAIDKASLIGALDGKREEAEELARQLKAQLKRRGSELKHARRELTQHRKTQGWGFDKIIARSVSMQGVVREAKRMSPTDLPVLLVGENGTGKELVARSMHLSSRRADMPFVAVNCAAFPENLLEAELFGHVRGSFTGAERDRPGLFEDANGGTLFLDEVGEMALSMQVKLLRALEVGEVRRVGESQVRTVDVRIISATNADVEMLIRKSKFREDLYYRLSGFVLRIPPLRERLDDVEPLAYAFVEEAALREGRHGLTITNDAIARLESFSWSGNVRELRNVILRAAVTAPGEAIRPEDIKFDLRTPAVLPGYDPNQADLILEEIASQGVELNPRQQTAVNRVLTRGKLHFGEYKQLFRVSKSTTARDLEQLVSLGLLEKRGKTRAVIYLPGAKLQEIARAIGGR